MTDKSRLDAALERIYSAATEELAGVMDVRNMYIAVYDKRTGRIDFPLGYENGKQITGKGYVESRYFGDRHGLTDWIIEHKEPLLISGDFEKEARRLNIEIYTDIPTKSWLGAPMLLGGEVTGVIGLNNFEAEGTYDEFHRDLLATIAGQAAVAIDNARLVTELDDANARLARLQDVGVKITSELDLQDVLAAVAENANGIMRADFSTLFLYDTERELFHHGMRIGVDKDEPLAPSRNGLAAQIALGQELVIAENALEHLVDEHHLIIQYGLKSFVGVPLTVRGKTVGVLFVDFVRHREFTDGEIEILTLLANQAAVAIENARLFDELAAARREAVRSTLSAMAGGYVHRLNGALGFIPASIQMIMPNVISNSREVLEDIRDGVIEALAYTRRMTDLFVGGELPREPVDLGLMLQGVASKVRLPDGVRLTWELDANSREIMVDKMFITEVFHNIIINAVEAMEGVSIGDITIGCRTINQDNEVLVWIADAGPGIPPEYLPKLFEPEFTTKPGKRGIGLWFCDTVVRVHGGRIEVDSTPKRGTVFSIVLPRDLSYNESYRT